LETATAYHITDIESTRWWHGALHGSEELDPIFTAVFITQHIFSY